MSLARYLSVCKSMCKSYSGGKWEADVVRHLVIGRLGPFIFLLLPYSTALNKFGTPASQPQYECIGLCDVAVGG